MLRNPWGKFEWQGDWSDNDSQWTDEMKEECNFISEDDGSFWMSFDDFQKIFSRIAVNEYNDDALLSFAKVEADEDNEASFFTLQLGEGHHIFSVT